MIHQRTTTIAGRTVKLYSRTGRSDDVWASSLREYDRMIRYRAGRLQVLLHGKYKPFVFHPWRGGYPRSRDS